MYHICRGTQLRVIYSCPTLAIIVKHINGRASGEILYISGKNVSLTSYTPVKYILYGI